MLTDRRLNRPAAFLMIFLFLLTSFPVQAGSIISTVVKRVSGLILLQVDSHGEAWYMDPVSARRYYLKDGQTAYRAMSGFGLGISNADLSRIPIGTVPTNRSERPIAQSTQTDLARRLSGRMLLQVQSHGEAWYVYPANGRRYYLKDGVSAYDVMRYFGLGISNADLSEIPVGEIPTAVNPVGEVSVAIDGVGGFREMSDSSAVRALLSRTQIATMLPSRGSFTFPAPYNTVGIRLSNATDCEGGADCVQYGYSYWRKINNHTKQSELLVLAGFDRKRGGSAGPTLFRVDKQTRKVTKKTPLFDSDDALSWGNTEGWYFSASADRPYTLYINSGSKMLRYNVADKTMQTVFDISERFGSAARVWQMHSSADDLVHSATLRDVTGYRGCLVYEETISRLSFYPKKAATFDECQVDKSGQWVVLKENVDGKNGEDNRIIQVATGTEKLLLDESGAGGHSDLGYGYLVAADNHATVANTVKLWNLADGILQGKIVHHNSDWSVFAPNHLSFANASIKPVAEQFACGSSANRKNSTRANEIFCFPLDGSKSVTVVAPVMTDLDAAGGGDDYAKQPKGNLDVTGKYFVWTSNLGGNRLDLFLVEVPEVK